MRRPGAGAPMNELLGNSKQRKAAQRGHYAEQTESVFEQQNDALAAELDAKVGLLKQLSIDIGTEVREQNKFLDGMDSDFDSTQGLFSTTMTKLDSLLSTGGSKHMCMLTIFVFVFFLLLYYFIL